MTQIIDFQLCKAALKRQQALNMGLKNTIAAGITAGNLPPEAKYLIPCPTCQACGHVKLEYGRLKPSFFKQDQDREKCPHCKGAGLIRALSDSAGAKMLLEKVQEG